MSAKAFVRPGVIVLSAALVLLVVAMAVLPATTQAASHPKQVRGYVYDQDGRKVAGAQVTVTMKYTSNNTTVWTEVDTSDSVGYFACDFAASEWYIGNRILVTATYNSLQATNTTVVLCDDAFFQWENITFPYEIPEFGKGYLGILITGLLVGTVAVAALVLLRKKK